MQTIGWPFRAEEALEGGALTFRELRRFHQAIYPGVWAPRGVELSATDRARAAWLWSRRGGVLAGLSASAMLGAKWIDNDLPAELIHTNRRPPPLIMVHTDELLSGETQTIRGLPMTTPARTAFDLGRRLSMEDGVQRIDALMNATDVKVDDIETVAGTHPGVRGLRQLRQTLDLVDGGAESPYESLTRLPWCRPASPPADPDPGARWVRPSRGNYRYGLAAISRGCRLRGRASLDQSEEPDVGRRAIPPAPRARLDRHQADERDTAQHSATVS